MGVELPEEFVVMDFAGELAANGIVSYGNGLLISHFSRGGVYYLDLTTGETTQVASSEDIPGPDGLTLAPSEDGTADLLYACDNFRNRLVVFSLSFDGAGTVTAEYAGEIADSLIDGPSTSAVWGDVIANVNNRPISASLAIPDELGLGPVPYNETFQVISVDRFEALVVPVRPEEPPASAAPSMLDSNIAMMTLSPTQSPTIATETMAPTASPTDGDPSTAMPSLEFGSSSFLTTSILSVLLLLKMIR